MKKFNWYETWKINLEKKEKLINDLINSEEYSNISKEIEKNKKSILKLENKISSRKKNDDKKQEYINEKNSLINKNNSFEIIKNLDIYKNDIFLMKKKIMNFVSKKDTSYNKIKLKIQLLKEKNESLDDLKFYKNNPEVKERREKILKDIKFFEENINSNSKNYFIELKKINEKRRELRKIDKKIKKSKSIVQNTLDLEIFNNNKEINYLSLKLKFKKKEINKYLKLINTIDELLNDKTDINDNYSFVINNLNAFYGNKQSLYDINIKFPKNSVISIIGPSGCGKSTFLKILNRINDEIPTFKVNGEILLDGEYDIYKLKSIKNKYKKIELTDLRTKVGMIFQQPNPFPISIFKNVTFGPRINGEKNNFILNKIAENSLKDAALWETVKDNLNKLGTSLSGGQQQRLCIARAIANEPEILLMDEPTSALDPISSSKIEDLIIKLKKKYTIIIVTHSMQQAARVSDYTAFFYEGRLIEFNNTTEIFSNPKYKKTEDYIRGKFG